MSRKQILIAFSAVLLLAVAIAAWLVLRPAPESAVTAATSGSGYQIAATDHTLGNPKAKVVLIEYAAPICPHCAHFNETVFPDLKKTYIDTGKVYYVFRVFPLHPADGAAEKIALCMPKDKYFSFMDLLFRNQPKWDPEYGIQDIHGGLIQMARLAGMDAAKADACISGTAEDAHINQVATDGATRYNITGTPTFVLDGAPVGQGTVPDLPTLTKFIDDALAAKK